MSCRVKGKPFVDSRSFSPRLDEYIHHRRTWQIENMIIRRLVSPFRHPLQRFRGKRQVNRFFGLLQGYSQAVLSSIDEDVFPLQSDNIAHAQSAEAGEQISGLHRLIIHRSGNQRPDFLDGHIRPFALRQANLIRIIDFRKRIDFDNLRTNGSVQSPVQDTVVGVECKVRHTLSFGSVLRHQIIEVILAECLVDSIHRHPLSCIVFQDANGNCDLVSVLFTSLCLILFICIHPIEQEYLFPVLDTRFPISQFDDALRLDCIGRIHRGLIPFPGIIVRFRDDIHFEVLVCPLSVAVNIQVQTLASVAQRLHPKTDWFFDFRRLLYSWHIQFLHSLFLLQR